MRAWQDLLRTLSQYKKMADWHRTKGPSSQVGQVLWLSTTDFSLRSECLKLYPWIVGPFPTSKNINSVAVRIKLPRSMKIHPSFHISQVKPCLETSNSHPPLHPGWWAVYTARRLLGVWKGGLGRQYLVDWEGYGPEARSWVSSTISTNSTNIWCIPKKETLFGLQIGDKIFNVCFEWQVVINYDTCKMWLFQF